MTDSEHMKLLLPIKKKLEKTTGFELASMFGKKVRVQVNVVVKNSE